MTSARAHCGRVVSVNIYGRHDLTIQRAPSRSRAFTLGRAPPRGTDRFGQKIAAKKLGATSGIAGGIFLEGPRLADDLVEIVQAWHVHAIRARVGQVAVALRPETNRNSGKAPILRRSSDSSR